ncbi:hypothetical protein D3C79_827460 [compost metagenome]
MLRQRLGIPQAHCPGKQLQGIHEAPPSLDTTLELKRNHPARQTHLPLCQFILGKRRQPRVMNQLYLRLPSQALRHLQRIGAVAVHAQCKGLDTAHQ